MTRVTAEQPYIYISSNFFPLLPYFAVFARSIDINLNANRQVNLWFIPSARTRELVCPRGICVLYINPLSVQLNPLALILQHAYPHRPAIARRDASPWNWTHPLWFRQIYIYIVIVWLLLLLSVILYIVFIYIYMCYFFKGRFRLHMGPTLSARNSRV